jgi:hypothetical protein
MHPDPKRALIASASGETARRDYRLHKPVFLTSNCPPKACPWLSLRRDWRNSLPTVANLINDFTGKGMQFFHTSDFSAQDYCAALQWR